MPDVKTIFTDPFKGIDLNKLIGQALEDVDKRVLAINKGQLNKGFDAIGDSLGKYKNFNYKGRFQPVDLYKTGEFWEKFTLTAGKKAAEIFSQDQKAPMLEKKYGKDIYGIDKQNLGTVETLILPILQESFAKEVTR